VRDGVQFIFRAQILQVLQQGAEKVLYHKVNGAIENLLADEILVGVGRAPNVEGLNLGAAGVLCDQHGIIVNDQLQTSNRRGFARVLVRKGTDKILGATIVAAHAGEMISEITLAMTNRLGLGDVVRTIHPYPTQAEVVKKLGDAYNRTRLTPFVKKILEKWLS